MEMGVLTLTRWWPRAKAARLAVPRFPCSTRRWQVQVLSRPALAFVVRRGLRYFMVPLVRFDEGGMRLGAPFLHPTLKLEPW